MNGARIVGCGVGEPEIKSGTSPEALAVGDLVVFRTDGQLELVDGGAGTPASGDTISGVAISAATAAGQTVYFVTGERLRILMDSDETGDAMAADMVGATFDVTGTTGAMKVDISTADQAGTTDMAQQLLCLENNPQGYGLGLDSDTSIGLFEIIKRQA